MATGVTSSITSNVAFTSRFQLTTDDDTLIIQGAKVSLDAPQGEIFTREGDDTVRVDNSTIEATAENLAFYLGDGNDSLSLKNSIISTPVYMGVGNDYVRIEGTIQTSTELNKKLSFGSGNDTLELIAMLQNTGGIDFGDGRNKLLFNGGALLGTGAVGNFTDLEVTLSGGTTGSNLILSGEQTTVTLNGNLFGTTDNNSISASNNTTTLTVGNNVRSNVKFNLNKATLIQADGGTFEISEHSGYAFSADAGSVVTIHDIVTGDGGAILGTGSTWTITNGNFSNSKEQTTLVLKNQAKLTGEQLSFASNKGLGAIQLLNASTNIYGFQANNNRVLKSSPELSDYEHSYESNGNGYGGTIVTAIFAPIITSACGGAIWQSDGNTNLERATFSGNQASAFASGPASAPFKKNTDFAFATAIASALGGAYYQNAGTAVLTSATFSRNIASALTSASAVVGASNGAQTIRFDVANAGGGAIYVNNGDLNINNTTFSQNNAYGLIDAAGAYRADANIIAQGGAIVQNDGSLVLSNVVFSRNTAFASYCCNYFSASNSGPFISAYGGAIHLENTIANMDNTEFSGNVASASISFYSWGSPLPAPSIQAYGGAIFLKGTTLNYAVASGKTLTNTGNNAIASSYSSASYGRATSAGGWLYATGQSTVNITVENDAKLIIGADSKYTDGSSMEDSIAGGSTGLITKNGAGLLRINSDISGYAGKWSINEGTLHLRRTFQTISLDDWTIGTNGKLVLSEEADIVNMGMSKKVGTIDFGGGAETVNTNGYDLTAGELLISTITFNGTGRISVKLTNRNTTKGNWITINGAFLDSNFTGNQYVDTIEIGKESTLGGKLDLAGGDDVITATAKATFTDTLKAGAGNDSLSFTDVTFEETVDLGDGDNTLKSTGKAKFSQSVSAGSGNDTLTFTSVTFEDALSLGDGANSLTASEEAKVQDIIGGTGNDTITMGGDSTISGEINLGTGMNSIHVNKKLTADRIRIANGGQTTVYVYYGTTLANNKLTVYSDEQADRETVTLNWSNQTDLDKVRILVSSNPSTFQNDQYEFAVELYNQSKSFSLDLQKGYFIQFQAQDDNGWKQRLLDDNVAPDQVTGVVFDGTTLTWDETHDNLGGNGVKLYHVEIAKDASFSTIIQSGTSTATTFSLNQSTEGQLYFRVKAEDYTGNTGAWSETVSGIIDNIPPSCPDNGNATINGYSATLSWSASTDGGSGVSGYEYRVATDSVYGQIISNGTTENCSLTLDSLGYGSYYWQVRAIDVSGNISDWTPNKSFMVVDAVAPDTPTNLTLTVGENGQSLSAVWNAAYDDLMGSGINGYDVQLAKDSLFTNIVKNLSVTATNTTIENLSNATYYMRVRSVDNAGNQSEWTEVKSVIIDRDMTPPTVSNVKADITAPTNGNVTVTATFSDDRGAVFSYYRIGELDGWRIYEESGVTVSNNNTVYFKAIDTSGNESEVVSYQVTNIDKEPPVKPTVLADVTERTDAPVTVSAAFSIDSVKKEYQLNGGEWKTYTEAIVFEENGYVSFRGTDEAGNVSEIETYTVSNIIPKAEIISNAVVTGGTTYVHSGQQYENATINGGLLYVEKGGVANSTTVNDEGKLHAGLWYSEGGGIANETTVNGGYFAVYRGGIANNTVINSGGRVFVSSGGTTEITTIQSAGRMYVSSSGIANKTTVFSGGTAYVYSGGIAANTKVNSLGNMSILSGGMITGQMTIERGAVVSIYTGATIDFNISEFTSNSTEAKINDLSLLVGWTNANYTLTVSDTSAIGKYTLAEGATGFNRTISVRNTSGKTLGSFSVGKTITISGLDYALDQSNGSLSVLIKNAEEVPVDTVSPTVSYVKADSTALTNGNVTITATFTDDVELAQSLYRVGETGTWINYEGGVTVYENTTVYFKAIDAAGNESQISSYDVRNIDKVAPSAPSGLKALKDEQTVVLIWNACTDNLSGIKEYIVKYSNGSQEYTIQTSNTNYMLSNLAFGSWEWSVQAVDAVGNVSAATDGAAFTVADVVPEPEKKFTTSSDINGNGISDVMFVWAGTTEQPGNYQHGYWINGTSEWQSANSGHPAEWENLGCYDMTGDGKADSVLVGNVVVNGVKGAYIGYYADANDLSDGSTWKNIGYLNNAENITWRNKVGNLTGGTANSIIWYAPELHALGTWKDGKEDWVSLSGNFGGDAWTLVGCGDFDGDGKDSVVMTLNKGQLFYSVGIDGSFTPLGGVNWAGWEVRAIGDFKGDGKDDMVLFHKDSGAMVMLGDGNANRYTSVGQLDASDWFVVGAGDYNGDQKDDLLVRQYSTGMLGYYTSGDTSKWNVLGYGVGMEWTVIA